MNYEDAYSPDYDKARLRILEQAKQLRLNTQALTVQLAEHPDPSLYIDVIKTAEQANKVLVISSGLHGVEGFLGSAIQLAWLKRVAEENCLPNSHSVLLIHAINPYGFKFIRRTNENNIDLNRNYFTENSIFDNNKIYSKFHQFLNPKGPQSGYNFALKALVYILMHGLKPLKTAITKGQYDHPDGLFYSGKTIAESTKLIQSNYHQLISKAKHVVHLDLHSGLGRFGQYKLLAEEKADCEKLRLFQHYFGDRQVESVKQAQTVAYQADATMSAWLSENTNIDYTHLAVEFGTYSNLRVLKSLVNENMAHKFLAPDDAGHQQAKSELLECFCPASPSWRTQAVKQGLNVIDQACALLNN